MPTNADIAGAFAEITTLLKLRGEDQFRIRAYERAAEAIASTSADLATIPASEIADVKGIGASTAKKVMEYRETGKIAMLEELRAEIPSGVVELLRIPGLGPKTAMAMHDELGIDSLDALRVALEEGRLSGLKGMGAKTEANLRESIARMGEKDDDRLAAADGLEIAKAVAAAIRDLDGVEHVAWAGSLRRMRDTVGDLDILVAGPDPRPVMEAIRSLSIVVDVLAAGDKKTSVLMRPPGKVDRRLQVDVRVVDDEAWGAALVYFTGSKAHNVRVRERAVRRGLKLNEYGLFRVDNDERVASRTEEDVYAALDLPWIPPTLREDHGEVEAADAGELPDVVTLADLKGDLHGHCDVSGDGRATLSEMVTAAAERGLEWWAVTDHAPNLRMNGASVEEFLERRKAIAELTDRLGVPILDGVELNIALDGSVDFDEEFLSTFDWCVASVHSLMTRGADDQTARICAAMQNPHVHAIGHPTGRKLGQRPGYDLHWDRIISTALETGTALEVNGSARRLDMSDTLVRRAAEAGVTITISSDAHAVGDLESLQWGVLTAQRGWVRADQVLNCQSADEVREWAASKPDRAR